MRAGSGPRLASRKRAGPRDGSTELEGTSGPGLERILLGCSHAIVALRDELRALARLPLRSVLVQGESGTGKDRVARALLACSRRPTAALEVFNCPAIPQDHLESELFGTLRGAYPGALDRPGAAERAAGGMLFLDEVAALDAAHQAKVLRLVESGEGRRLGASRPYRVDLTVVAATHEDLVACIEQGRFREDLYWRLVQDAVVHVPPLRERPADVPLLARHFLEELDGRLRLEPEALEVLGAQAWPGNVRQLRAVMRGAARLGKDEDDGRHARVGAEAIREALRRLGRPRSGPEPASMLAGSFHESAAHLRRELLVEALARSHGNQTQAGVLLGLHRSRSGGAGPLDARARKRAHRKFRYWWGRLVEPPDAAPEPPVPRAPQWIRFS